MRYQEIKALNEADKKKKLADLKMQLVKLNLQVSTGTTLKKPKELREIKKDIARILTSLNNKKEVKKE
jgi:large subunit ribosomal protein L29